jgi:hypothetical protein
LRNSSGSFAIFTAMRRAYAGCAQAASTELLRWKPPNSALTLGGSLVFQVSTVLLAYRCRDTRGARRQRRLDRRNPLGTRL